MEIPFEYYKFRVANDTPLGKGCIAQNKIVKGEIICKFIGPLISHKDYCDKYGSNKDNVLQIGIDQFIDLIPPFVYFNHSCSPNAGIRNNGVLFALRDIENGEEIFYDYSTTADEIYWQMECGCRQTNCRKIIGDFMSLPNERKFFYLENNALLAFIKRIYF